MMSKAYAILDYDGFICKSYYAALSKYFEVEPEFVLDRLEEAAIKKAATFFDVNEVVCIRLVSGHSWKKETYTSYKGTRKRDEYLGVYREMIAERDDVMICPGIEADDGVSLYAETLSNRNEDMIVVFSDDKDLECINVCHCKINIDTEIRQPNTELIYCQMLAGDKEDDIQGIPKVGIKTAQRLLSQESEYNLKDKFERVIEIYYKKNIPLQECIKNLNLVIPLSSKYCNNEREFFRIAKKIVEQGINNSEQEIMQIVNNQQQFISNTAKHIYNYIEAQGDDKNVKQDKDTRK